MSTFFANLASGMSMQYGLGSSLFKLERLITDYVSEREIDNIPIYDRIVLVDLSQSVITDSAPNNKLDLQRVPFSEMEKKDFKLLAHNSSEGLKIRLLQTVYLQNSPVALIVADISNELITSLLTTQEHTDYGSRIILNTPRGNIFIWDSLNIPQQQTGDRLADKIYIDTEVNKTPFKLISWFAPLHEQDLFTSGWFIIVLSSFAIPIMLGFYFLLRVSNFNVQLKTQVSDSSKQQQDLTQQNQLLQIEIMRRKASESKLEHQATHDVLTNLPNRKFGYMQLEQAISRSQRNGSKVLVLFLDLDNFKQINDTLGHHAGDLILQQASQRLYKAIRNTDTVARLGGDEFLLIIPELEEESDAKKMATKILALFEQPFVYKKQEFFTTISIGMSIYPQDGDNTDSLLQNADTALYRVKAAGRNGFSFYNANMNKDVLRSLALDNRLRQAIANNELEMYYQPILDLKSRKIIAAEALMRWNDRELGHVSPDEFISLAEKNGLIHSLGEYALEQACAKAAEWQSIHPINIAVNFSSVQFRDCDALLKTIQDTLQKTNLPANRLDIEVTESLLINQDEDLINMLERINQLGIQLSIDDFGTGYSSLSYLQKFSFSKLKIDRAFIKNMVTSEADRALVTAIIAMAKALGLKVVAEGVEDNWQAGILKNNDCEFGQGYLFSRPVPASEFKQLLIQDNQ
ncbi:MAG: EAL domain-containing protein [Psychromonas sp.]